MTTVMDANEQKERIEAKRERKAARTLAIITGCFLSCWLPFSLTALINPLCPTFHVPDELRDVLNWLGFINSLLNPIIYTIFSPDFRNAFRKIIFGRYINPKSRPSRL
ncbi:5-hydroxytryptamine receptor [Cichlidogyrus casuarinus]|uniref:5-hydroxytryptamine receptor n=1 Tax=Cichlidogyrus casuarinus TaxID=1844966 RepID=A0ABD2Q7F2_9PLAT